MVAAVRPTRAGDVARLQDIERRAGARFRAVGLPQVADHEPASVDELTAYASDGRSWVAVDDADTPIGYVLVDVVDGFAHIEQVSVLPEHQGGGVGRALVAQATAWAVTQHLAAVALTTFRDVPWNAPLYRRLGFRDLTEDELGPELQELRAEEAAHGLDPTQRVCMRAELP